MLRSVSTAYSLFLIHDQCVAGISRVVACSAVLAGPPCDWLPDPAPDENGLAQSQVSGTSQWQPGTVEGSFLFGQPPERPFLQKADTNKTVQKSIILFRPPSVLHPALTAPPAMQLTPCLRPDRLI